MPGLIGKYSAILDAKNRLVLPAKLRKSKSVNLDSFVLTLGLNRCLYLFPPPEWDKIEQRLEDFTFADEDANRFSRMLTLHAKVVELDTQHRVSIPPELLSEVSIQREVLILGVIWRIELWEPSALDEYLKSSDMTYEQVAARLMRKATADGDTGR
jgi:MraZ protein